MVAAFEPVYKPIRAIDRSGLSGVIGVDDVKSPCVAVCKLDERNVCIGCWRTLEEIAAWSRMNRQQKLVVLENCGQRAQAEKRA